MKQKIKKVHKLKKFGLLVVGLTLASLFLLFKADTASAVSDNCALDRASNGNNGVRVCQLSNIKLKTDILVKDSSGSYVAGNYVNVSPTTGATFKVRVTLVQPVDLRVKSGNLSGADYIYFPPPYINANISGFGASIVPQDTTKFCGTIDERNGTYKRCKGEGNLSSSDIKSSLTVLKAGDVVFEKEFTISPGTFKNYGVTNVKSATSPGLNRVIAYPDLALDFVGYTDWTTFFDGGKDLFLRLYPSDTDLKSDTSAPPQCLGVTASGTSTPPSCVPAYGSNTANGANVGDSASIYGNPIIWLLKQIIGGILGIVQELIYAIFFYFVAPFIQAMLSIHPYTDTFVAVIYPGWEVVRNLCNMLFVVALIIIALATLFRVDSYQFKNLIIQLIIAALLINFSLVIAQAVLALADTIQAQFLPANVTVIRSLAGNLMVNNWRDAFLNLGSPFASQGSTAGSLSDIIQPIFFVSLSLGSFAVFVAIMVFLGIRIVALWVLLLISPIAYACGVLPATASYRAQWWQTFIKYAFFTPIMCFFLNMTAIMANQYTSGGNPILKSLTTDAVARDLGGSDIAAFVFKLSSNVLLLVFLIAGLKVADMAGILGASGITKLAQNGIFAPFAGAGFLAKAGLSKGKLYYDSKTLPMASSKNPYTRKLYGALHLPSTIEAAITDSTKEREKMKHLTEAAALKVKREVPGFRREGRDPLYHALLEQGEERLNEVYGHYTSNESEEVRRTEELEKRALAGDQNAKMMLLAQWFRDVKGRHDNQFLENKGLDYTQSNVIGILENYVKKGVFSHTVVEELMTALSEIGYDKTNYVLAELSDGKNEIHVEEVKDASGNVIKYRIAGEKEWDFLTEWARKYVESQISSGKIQANQAGALYESLLKNDHENHKGILYDHAFDTVNKQMKQDFKAATHHDFDDHHFENADLRQFQILKRDTNASKLERKFGIFHNAFATTDAEQVITGSDGKKRRKIVFGESGNYILTHLDNPDIWSASRNALTDKHKKWLFGMLKDYSLPELKQLIEHEYKNELARDHTYKSQAEISEMVQRKVNMMVSAAYAAKTNAGTQPIANMITTKTARKINADNLDKELIDSDLKIMIDEITS